jgi:cytoskeleton-associated protein 5
VFSKATADGNAAALDKALDALQAYLGKAPESAAARFAGSVSSNIVKKTCGARPSTAAKGIDCLLGLVELEQADKVMVSGWRTWHHRTP